MSPLSCARNPASGPEAVGKPATAGRGYSVIFWRSPCPHGVVFTGIEDVEGDVDFDEILEAIFETDEDNDFEDFIEYFDNQWW